MRQKVKIIIVLFYLASPYSYAQVVNIPDTSFQSSLRKAGVDKNNNGSIEFSEAQLVDSLHLSMIHDFTGLEAFTSLTKLKCYYFLDSILNLQYQKHLRYLDLRSGNLKSLDLSNNPQLTHLSCVNIGLSELDLSHNPNLHFFDCSYNDIKTLDVTSNTSLQHLNCNSNELTNLDLSNNHKLIYLSCNDNDLANLGVSKNIELTYLNCHYNKLTRLDLTNNSELKELSCYQNKIVNLDLTHNPKLTWLNCKENEIMELDLRNNSDLGYLNCSKNHLSILYADKCTAMRIMDCSFNRLTELDPGNLKDLTYLNCSNNNLSLLNIQTNEKLKQFYSAMNPNLPNVYMNSRLYSICSSKNRNCITDNSPSWIAGNTENEVVLNFRHDVDNAPIRFKADLLYWRGTYNHNVVNKMNYYLAINNDTLFYYELQFAYGRNLYSTDPEDSALAMRIIEAEGYDSIYWHMEENHIALMDIDMAKSKSFEGAGIFREDERYYTLVVKAKEKNGDDYKAYKTYIYSSASEIDPNSMSSIYMYLKTKEMCKEVVKKIKEAQTNSRKKKT